MFQKEKTRVNITAKMSLKEIGKKTALGENWKYSIYSNIGALRALVGAMKLKMFAGTWNVDSILYGMDHLQKAAEKEPWLFPLYSEAECADDAQKAEVNLMAFPVENSSSKPYVILCAGGAYAAVCSAVEAYPIAAHLNELGYSAFALTYRVGRNGIMPAPIDDLAAAVRYLQDHAEELGIGNEYIVSGFSAGGNLTALWGTDNLGYKKYGLPKPKALWPIYPLVTFLHGMDIPILRVCRFLMLGRKPSKKLLDQYEVCNHVSGDYPPAYIVNCLDDSSVPPINGNMLNDALEKNGVRCVLEQGETGEHGFGDGRGTSVEGWIDRAVSFTESL